MRAHPLLPFPLDTRANSLKTVTSSRQSAHHLLSSSEFDDSDEVGLFCQWQLKKGGFIQLSRREKELGEIQTLGLVLGDASRYGLWSLVTLVQFLEVKQHQ